MSDLIVQKVELLYSFQTLAHLTFEDEHWMTGIIQNVTPRALQVLLPHTEQTTTHWLPLAALKDARLLKQCHPEWLQHENQLDPSQPWCSDEATISKWFTSAPDPLPSEAPRKMHRPRRLTLLPSEKASLPHVRIDALLPRKAKHYTIARSALSETPETSLLPDDVSEIQLKLPRWDQEALSDWEHRRAKGHIAERIQTYWGFGSKHWDTDDIALARAKLSHLFGKPNDTTDDYKISFSYLIEIQVGTHTLFAIIADWKARLVDVGYVCPPGLPDAALTLADQALWELLTISPLASFVAQFTYDDCKGVRYYCKDGVPRSDFP